MSGKILITIFALGIVVIAGGVGAFLLVPKLNQDTETTASATPEEQNGSAPISEPEQKIEPKTEEFVAQRVADYWENTRFGDFGPNYELMYDDVKRVVSREVFIQKYKEDREENPLRKPEKVEVGDVRIEGETAVARVTVFTLFYTEGSPGTTELQYENGRWCLTRKPDTLKWLQE